MLGLGLALGGLFRLLVSSESTENQRFMAMVGIICFSTGAAFFLDLSALTVNLVLGAVLVQGAEGPQLDRTLTSTLGPVVLLLLVLAGVVWTPVSPLQGGVLAVALLASRSLLKVAGGAIAAAGNPVRADIEVRTVTNGGGLGQAVVGAGDLDADGLDDVVVAAPHHDNLGRLAVVRGTGVVLFDELTDSAAGLQVGGKAGGAMAAMGDVDSDGHADLAVAIPNLHFEAGRSRAGAVFLLHGPISGASVIEDSRSWESPTEHIEVGTHLAAVPGEGLLVGTNGSDVEAGFLVRGW